MTLDHSQTQCTKFKGLEDRVKVVKIKKLCFNCLFFTTTIRKNVRPAIGVNDIINHTPNQSSHPEPSGMNQEPIRKVSFIHFFLENAIFVSLLPAFAEVVSPASRQVAFLFLLTQNTFRPRYHRSLFLPLTQNLANTGFFLSSIFPYLFSQRSVLNWTCTLYIRIEIKNQRRYFSTFRFRFFD